jgi:small nuclear ribonucleoprotein (snRNP)-like protein
MGCGPSSSVHAGGKKGDTVAFDRQTNLVIKKLVMLTLSNKLSLLFFLLSNQTSHALVALFRDTFYHKYVSIRGSLLLYFTFYDHLNNNK